MKGVWPEKRHFTRGALPQMIFMMGYSRQGAEWAGHCAPPKLMFGKTPSLMADRDMHLEALIDAVYPLERGLEALEKSRQPGALKVLIKP